MTSWWVGKDREAFDIALKEHTERIMRTGGRRTAPARTKPTAGVVAVEVERAVEVPVPVVEAPARDESAVDRPRADPPTQKPQWRPGSRGRVPISVQPCLNAAREFRAAIENSEEAQRDPALGRAAVVMLVGFLFRQRLDWVVGFTKYGRTEVARVARTLHQNHVWMPGGFIACKWMELACGPRIAKGKAWEFEVAFWLDALVAKGEVTRETRDGEFYYGLRQFPEVRS